MTAFGSGAWFGQMFERLFGQTLVFTFEGLLIASLIVNIPFAVQPIQRAFEAVGPDCARRRKLRAVALADAVADRAAACLAGHTTGTCSPSRIRWASSVWR